MATVIRTTDWIHTGRYDRVAYCVDSDNQYKVMLYANYDRYGNVSDLNLVGEINSVLDRHNMYYYDLSQDVLTNRAWLCPYKTFEEVLDSMWHVCSDIEIPSWFVERAEKLREIESECKRIADGAMSDIDLYGAIERYVSKNVSDDFVQLYNEYMDSSLVYDVMDVMYEAMKDRWNGKRQDD